MLTPTYLSVLRAVCANRMTEILRRDGALHQVGTWLDRIAVAHPRYASMLLEACGMNSPDGGNC